MSLYDQNLRRDVNRNKPSAYALIAVNVLPLFGVLFLGWRAFDVVFLYWLENVLIGAINVLKILTCCPQPLSADERMKQYKQDLSDYPVRDIAEVKAVASMTGPVTWQLSKLFFAPFFAVHYGGFCLVHGMFVCALLGEGGPLTGGMSNPLEVATQALGNPGLLVAALALGASHLVSYFTNYLGRGEYRRTLPPLLMFQPYGRVIVLHVAIVLSGFLTFLLGSPIWLLVLLVAGKTWLDLVLHLREHKCQENEQLEEAVLTTT